MGIINNFENTNIRMSRIFAILLISLFIFQTVSAASVIQIRRDTAANWATADPTLAQGEFGFEIDDLKIKIGDGSTVWNSLGYFFTGDGGGGVVYTSFGSPIVVDNDVNKIGLNVTPTDDWNGLFDGQEGSYYKDDLNGFMTGATFDSNIAVTSLNQFIWDSDFNSAYLGAGTGITWTQLNAVIPWADVNILNSASYLQNSVYAAGASLTLEPDTNKFNVNDANLALTFYSQTDANNVFVKINDLNNGTVSQIIAGTNITVSPTNGIGIVTVNASGGTGGVTYTSGTPATLQVNNDNNTISQNFDGNFNSRLETWVGSGIPDANILNFVRYNQDASCDGNASCNLLSSTLDESFTTSDVFNASWPVDWDTNLTNIPWWAASNPDTNVFTGCGDTNNFQLGSGECVFFDRPDVYFPTAVVTIAGTDFNNNSLPAILNLDNNSYSIQEDIGANPIIMDVNFSDVNRLDSINMREQYTGSAGHEIVFEIWNWVDEVFEEFLEITDQDNLVTENIPIVDSTNFISPDGNVWTRFRHVQAGNPAHSFLLDWIQGIKGTSTITNIEHDALSGRASSTNHPWAVPTDGSRDFTGSQTNLADFNALRLCISDDCINDWGDVNQAVDGAFVRSTVYNAGFPVVDTNVAEAVRYKQDASCDNNADCTIIGTISSPIDLNWTALNTVVPWADANISSASTWNAKLDWSDVSPLFPVPDTNVSNSDRYKQDASCDNNASCTLLSSTLTPLDLNWGALNQVVPWADVNILNAARFNQDASCDNNASCLLLTSTLSGGIDLNWTALNQVVPWADANVADDITLTNITQITNRDFVNINSRNFSLLTLDDNSSFDLRYVNESDLNNGTVSQLIAGTNITLSPVNGIGVVTVNAVGGSFSDTTLDTNVSASESYLATQHFWNADNNFSNVDINVLQIFETLRVGTGAASNSGDSQILIARDVDDTIAGNGHAFSDSSDITRGGNIGYNSFDAAVDFLGTENYDHYAGFQFAPSYASSGTMSVMYGLFSKPIVSAGTVTNLYAIGLGNPTVTGTVTNYRALSISTPTAGSSTNYAIYSGGGNNFFGGNILMQDVGIGNNADGVLAMTNGTAPTTSPNNVVQLYSKDVSAGDASLHIMTESDEIYSFGSYALLPGTVKVSGSAATPLGTLHIETGNSGSTPSASAADLVVENSADGGISILVPTASESFLVFGTNIDAFGAAIAWDETTDIFRVYTANAGGMLSFRTANNVEAVRIDAVKNMGLGTATFDGTVAGYFAIANGTEPAAHTDNQIYIGSKDSSNNTSTLSLFLEEAVVIDAPDAADAYVPIWINGTEYNLHLTQVVAP